MYYKNPISFMASSEKKAFQIMEGFRVHSKSGRTLSLIVRRDNEKEALIRSADIKQDLLKCDPEGQIVLEGPITKSLVKDD